MKRFHQLHECCPPQWRRTHLITGDYDFDANIERRARSPDLWSRIVNHISGDSYGPRTSYQGYSGMSGDD